MLNITAVVTDLDGTIVDENGCISDITMRAARDLKQRNIPLIVATARSPDWIKSRREFCQLLTAGVFCNGGIGWSPAFGRLLWRELIPSVAVRTVVHYIQNATPSFGLALYDGYCWHATESYLKSNPPKFGDVRPVSLEELYKIDAHSMWISGLEEEIDVLRRKLCIFSPALHVNLFADDMLGVGPAGIDKASGLRLLLDTLSIDARRSIAFGDMLNDLSMFELCGYSVAMLNAHPALIAVASRAAPCVHNDGFARILCDLDLITSEVLLGSNLRDNCCVAL